MSEILYLNGEYVAVTEAKISVFDRGFMFGDGVYEVIPVYAGNLLRGKTHLNRLQHNLDAIGVPNPLDLFQWMEIMTTLIAHNKPGADSIIYLQVTRGTMTRRDHAWGDDLVPSVLATCSAQSHASQELNTVGEKAVTLADTRWSDCHINTINLLPNALLHQKAREMGAIDAILIRDGFAIEGAQSNLFIVFDDIIITPPKSRYMGGGITREIILDLCKKNKVICREKDISEDELHRADEVWLSSSMHEIVPIVTLNQHAVGKGRVGDIWRQVIQLYHLNRLKVMRAPDG